MIVSAPPSKLISQQKYQWGNAIVIHQFSPLKNFKPAGKIKHFEAAYFNDFQPSRQSTLEIEIIINN